MVVLLGDTYARGAGLERARQLGAEQTIQELRLARLRGRGGAGFPTGRKWASVRAAGSPVYLAVNAAEGEPGTFKDRALLRHNAHQMVEGAAIAAAALGAAEVHIGVKRSYERERAAIAAAVDAALADGWFDAPVHIDLGPDDYLFGEEKALIEVMEGGGALPRLLPPYQDGLKSSPTVVNNVETLSNVPHILARGAEWFRSIGTDDSPGTIVCTISGDTGPARVAEVEMGTPIGSVLGEPAPGRTIKAVFSGVANPVLLGSQLDTPLTYEDMAAAGSGLGSAGFVVYDDTACMVEVARLFSRFLWMESCSQCPACKLGTEEITTRLTSVESGYGSELDLEVIGARLLSVTDSNRCALPVEEQDMVSSVLRAFPDEFVEHLEGRGCPRPRALELPVLRDL